MLSDADTPYAIIGGIALQFHQIEPRTTLDINLAIPSRDMIPRAQLISAGFVETGRFAHSENWSGPGSTPVQFTDDPRLAEAIQRADLTDLDGVPLRVLGLVDLLHEKLRASSDPARRRSKRLQDLADAQSLLEASPELSRELRDDERARLDDLPE